MKRFSKKTFLGFDFTPRRLMWERIARLEEQAGRFADDREMAFRLVAELDAKLRKFDQPRERGRFARKRVQPVVPSDPVTEVPADAVAEFAAGSLGAYAAPGDSVKFRAGRPSVGRAGFPAGLSADVPATLTSDVPVNAPEDFFVSVPFEFSNGCAGLSSAGVPAPAASGDSVHAVPEVFSDLRAAACGCSRGDDSVAWPSDIPPAGFAGPLAGLSVRTLSDATAEDSATRFCNSSAVAEATTPAVSVSDSPRGFRTDACTNVPSEMPLTSFVSSAGDFPCPSCGDFPSSPVFDTPATTNTARCATSADSLCPSCAAPASPSSPSDTPPALSSLGSASAETFKFPHLPS